jgi:chemotaxis signal transduction protein
MDPQLTSIDQESPSDIRQIRHGFEIGSYSLLISEQTRAEVAKSPSICAIPSTPDWFSGFINHRGETVPVYDLNKYLQVLDEKADDQDWVLLIDDHPNTVGVLLKRPPQSITDPELLNEAVTGLPEIFEKAVFQVYGHKDHKWFEIDHRRLFLALKKQF